MPTEGYEVLSVNNGDDSSRPIDIDELAESSEI